MTIRRWDWLVAALTAAVALTAFAPWAVSGTVTRSGWDLATTASRLEVATSPVARALLASFFFVPAGAAATFVATVARRRAVAMATSTLTIVVAASGAAIVAASPLTPSWGLYLNLVVAGSDLLIMVVPRLVER